MVLLQDLSALLAKQVLQSVVGTCEIELPAAHSLSAECDRLCVFFATSVFVHRVSTASRNCRPKRGEQKGSSQRNGRSLRHHVKVRVHEQRQKTEAVLCVI